jgi:serine/threonine-protein kinase
MSSVFRAVHVDTQHEVALKVLTRTLARNSVLLQRFLREARSAEALEHPNIVMIYDRGIDHGRHYLVLEYVQGGDFHGYIQHNGPLSVREAVSVVKQVADGLDYAAGKGLIHRDIKPSNVLRTAGGQIKIIDLGLARQSDFEDERVTREGTTVGTVDYMAPEQARDSRATSVRSDLYSLGCTFYYFLTGVPPYPGGDITAKLTRHAKSPAPDVRDLRPDVPLEISAIVKRMMAKKPEDRFASYGELIAALDAVPVEEMDKASAVAPIPLVGAKDQDISMEEIDLRLPQRSGESPRSELDDEEIKVASLAELAALEPAVNSWERSSARPAALEPPFARQRAGGPVDYRVAQRDPDAIAATEPSKGGSSASVWIIAGAFVGAACLIVALGLFQLIETPGTTENSSGGAGAEPESSAAEIRPVVIEPSSSRAAVSSARSEPAVGPGVSRAPVRAKPIEPELKWDEPVDIEPAAIKPGAALGGAPAALELLPAWARAATPERLDGPFVAVRRVPEPEGGTTTVGTLHIALDRFIGGTVELRDEGPFLADDLRFGGASRLIRSRPGYRSILRIGRSSSDAVRRQLAVFMLERKNLALDGLDLLVNVRDLSPNQTALFSCDGASLTLRNCSITIIQDPARGAFTVFRLESAGSSAAHVRLEQTLVRGGFSDAFVLAGGAAELVLRDCAVIGGSGPLFRFAGDGDAALRRCVLLGSLLAGPGPIFEHAAAAGPRGQRPVLQSYGSVLSRLHGSGIASVISSSDPGARPSQQLQWWGDRNLFAGWKGFLAAGKDHLVTIADLAAARVTWSGSDKASQEILSPWPYPPSVEYATPAAFSAFLSGQEAILGQTPQPRSGLFEKTIAAYAVPSIPEPIAWALDRAVPARPITRGPLRLDPRAEQGGAGGVLPPGTLGPAGPRAAAPPRAAPMAAEDGLELTFDTGAQPWNGDLGAFLRARLPEDVKHARVRVVGSGPHPCSPVRLPRGLWLEIRVEPLAAAEPPSWSVESDATGSGLIELRGGTLVLSNVVLRHAAKSRLDHLLDVEDGNLVLSRCQLTAPALAGDFAGDLIAFRSLSTQPRGSDPGGRLFSEPVDRPICRLVDSTLITRGTALAVELGKGLVALSQCAIASGSVGIELRPAKVARHRFEADLVLDHCTMTSERSIVRVGPWPGRAPGPDRPWLVTSRNCAFLGLNDRSTRQTVLLRADADALACGTVFWQAEDDAADVDFFVVTGEGLPASNRVRDVQHQWVRFWGQNHMRHVDGPRGATSPPTVRFRERLGLERLEPAGLILDPDYHPGRSQLTAGADLGRQGITLPPRRQVGRAR